MVAFLLLLGFHVFFRNRKKGDKLEPKWTEYAEIPANYSSAFTTRGKDVNFWEILCTEREFGVYHIEYNCVRNPTQQTDRDSELKRVR